MAAFVELILPEELTDDENLYRWIHHLHHQDGELKPGAFVFSRKDDGVSIALARLTTRDEFHQRAKETQNASVVFPVSVPREKDLIVQHDGEGHYSHGVITGFQDPKKFSNSQLKSLERFFLQKCAGTLEVFR